LAARKRNQLCTRNNPHPIDFILAGDIGGAKQPSVDCARLEQLRGSAKVRIETIIPPWHKSGGIFYFVDNVAQLSSCGLQNRMQEFRQVIVFQIADLSN